MRNLLALIGLVVVVFGGVGWYMGWYTLSFSKDSDGKLQIKTVVDTPKAGSDTSDFIKNVSTGKGTQAGQDVKAPAPNSAPGGTPGPITLPQNIVPKPMGTELPITTPPPPAPRLFPFFTSKPM